MLNPISWFFFLFFFQAKIIRRIISMALLRNCMAHDTSAAHWSFGLMVSKPVRCWPWVSYRWAEEPAAWGLHLRELWVASFCRARVSTVMSFTSWHGVHYSRSFRILPIIASGFCSVKHHCIIYQVSLQRKVKQISHVYTNGYNDITFLLFSGVQHCNLSSRYSGHAAIGIAWDCWEPSLTFVCDPW